METGNVVEIYVINLIRNVKDKKNIFKNIRIKEAKMKDMRIMGNFVRKISKERSLESEFISEFLDCTRSQYEYFLDGRLFLTLDQLEKLANLLGVTLETLMDGDKENYEKTVVHNNGEFENAENRETILDIIDDYHTLKNRVKGSGLK